MSRSIHIGYYASDTKAYTNIEVQPPYCLLGSQTGSMAFWKIPQIKQIGIESLLILGESEPVSFMGRDQMAELHHELLLLEQNLESIDYSPEWKAKWLSHLFYCYH